MKLLLLAAFLGLACAGEQLEYEKKAVDKVVEYNAAFEEHSYASRLIYQGKYPGKCGNDGFYYNDLYSFVICSNGNAYTQRCAPGSVNSGYSHYEHGRNYYYHDFCDVNLVDEGYAVRHSGYGAPFRDFHGYDHGFNHGYNHGYNYGYPYGRSYEHALHDGHRADSFYHDTHASYAYKK